MTDQNRTFKNDEAPTPAAIMNNPMADATVTSTKQFGPHDISVCDDGSTIVNGEHVCFDSIGATEELETDDQLG